MNNVSSTVDIKNFAGKECQESLKLKHRHSLSLRDQDNPKDNYPPPFTFQVLGERTKLEERKDMMMVMMIMKVMCLVL